MDSMSGRLSMAKETQARGSRDQDGQAVQLCDFASTHPKSEAIRAVPSLEGQLLLETHGVTRSLRPAGKQSVDLDGVAFPTIVRRAAVIIVGIAIDRDVRIVDDYSAIYRWKLIPSPPRSLVTDRRGLIGIKISKGTTGYHAYHATTGFLIELYDLLPCSR